ncbi:hypothetical protein MIND_01130000 [Mycena indigotica]|uniref:DUF6532 domain-containing protein n=1 Tax=Mycena indigotica TaxID=2126181 RepID=A0A8H6S840_9AGAR|nr:uncharacterized protein MIND_01130000 [Mycena indigotica]KAF7293517.1 hypothetical protein MIND_01130000 [Mycena indigotica]
MMRPSYFPASTVLNRSCQHLRTATVARAETATLQNNLFLSSVLVKRRRQGRTLAWRACQRSGFKSPVSPRFSLLPPLTRFQRSPMNSENNNNNNNLNPNAGWTPQRQVDSSLASALQQELQEENPQLQEFISMVTSTPGFSDAQHGQPAQMTIPQLYAAFAKVLFEHGGPQIVPPTFPLPNVQYAGPQHPGPVSVMAQPLPAFIMPNDQFGGPQPLPPQSQLANNFHPIPRSSSQSNIAHQANNLPASPFPNELETWNHFTRIPSPVELGPRDSASQLSFLSDPSPSASQIGLSQSASQFRAFQMAPAPASQLSLLSDPSPSASRNGPSNSASQTGPSRSRPQKMGASQMAPTRSGSHIRPSRSEMGPSHSASQMGSSTSRMRPSHSTSQLGPVRTTTSISDNRQAVHANISYPPANPSFEVSMKIPVGTEQGLLAIGTSMMMNQDYVANAQAAAAATTTHISDAATSALEREKPLLYAVQSTARGFLLPGIANFDMYPPPDNNFKRMDDAFFRAYVIHGRNIEKNSWEERGHECKLIVANAEYKLKTDTLDDAKMIIQHMLIPKFPSNAVHAHTLKPYTKEEREQFNPKLSPAPWNPFTHQPYTAEEWSTEQKKAVKAMLADDSFVHNTDTGTRSDTNTRCAHPAVATLVCLISQRKNVGLAPSPYFIPPPMLAMAITMLRRALYEFAYGKKESRATRIAYYHRTIVTIMNLLTRKSADSFFFVRYLYDLAVKTGQMPRATILQGNVAPFDWHLSDD